jgi:DnaK suppressor protein
MSFSYQKAKQDLVEERAQLAAQLAHLEEAEYERVGYSNHMADDGTNAFEQAVGVSLSRNIGSALASVERALAKFDDGTYGLCEDCGARIERARLEVLPHARCCLNCQSRREQKETRNGSR